MPSIVTCDSNSGFPPIFSQMLTDLDEIWQDLFVARITLVGRIWLRLMHGRLQAKPKRLRFFVILKNIQCHDLGGKPFTWHRGLCCREKFGKVSNVGGSVRAKTAVFPVSCSQPSGKVLLQTNRTNGNRTLRRCAFGSSQSIMYQQPQMGNPKPTENSGSINLFHPLYPTYKVNWIERYDYFSRRRELTLGRQHSPLVNIFHL